MVTTLTNESKKRFLLKKFTKQSRFRPVEIGNVDGVRTIIETVPECMTALGGASMLAVAEKRIGLVAALNNRINDIRSQHLILHHRNDILLQRVFQIASGFADGNDSDLLRADPAILLALNRNPVTGSPGASQETISRFESLAIDEVNIKSVQELLVDHYLASLKERPKEIVLDFDGTMIKTFGAQEGSIFRGGKYKSTMYFPLKIFWGDALLATILRCGDQSESKTILESLKMVVGKLQAKWQGLKIKVRLDAAFGSSELYFWLRKEGIGYEVGMPSNSVLNSCSRSFKEIAEKEFRQKFGDPKFMGDGSKTGKKDGRKQAHVEHERIRGIENSKQRMAEEKVFKKRRVRIVGEFSYKAKSWANWERIICRVDFTDQGFDIHFIVVSQQTGNPKKIYENDYCLRGLAEQTIGLYKQTGRRLSAMQFNTNQLRLTLYGIAYMLLIHLRKSVAKRLRKADIETLRKELIMMPMVIHQTEKKLTLQISEKHINCREFLATWRRLSAA